MLSNKRRGECMWDACLRACLVLDAERLCSFLIRSMPCLAGQINSMHWAGRAGGQGGAGRGGAGRGGAGRGGAGRAGRGEVGRVGRGSVALRRGGTGGAAGCRPSLQTQTAGATEAACHNSVAAPCPVSASGRLWQVLAHPPAPVHRSGPEQFILSRRPAAGGWRGSTGEAQAMPPLQVNQAAASEPVQRAAGGQGGVLERQQAGQVGSACDYVERRMDNCMI